MTPPPPDSHQRGGALRRQLKSLIQDLHGGLPADAAKARFDEAIRNVSPREIGDVEEQLIREGTHVTEIQRLCDLHVSMVRGALDRQKEVTAPAGHPVHTYVEENRIISALADRLGEGIHQLGEESSDDTLLEALQGTLDELSAVHNHYLRKENELFPVLERHGITGPPKVMWGVHDDIRRQLKGVRVSLETLRSSDINARVTGGSAGVSLLERTREALVERGTRLARAIGEMVYKENKILFPMALQTLGYEEWAAIRRGEDALGYAFDGPAAPFPAKDPGHLPEDSGTGLSLPVLGSRESVPSAVEGAVPASSPNQVWLELGTGRLTLEQVDLILRQLPVDLSFVDAEGFVRYYSETRDRLFPRTPGAIGRHVENCHPPKSLPMVREILRAFASGEQDVAEFWLELEGKFIHIRYCAVRNARAEYLGCLEVGQDVTQIRALEGQRRHLKWN